MEETYANVWRFNGPIGKTTKIETARCLEEGIVETVNEADMGLIMGIGFPPFRGGALRYADSLGLDVICQKADKYAHIGKLYHPTEKMREMAANGQKYYS